MLREFLNLEHYSSSETVVLIHDCIPIHPATATADRRSGQWTGDIWKLLSALIKFRPDLNVFVTPAPPSDLAIITNLDSTKSADFE